MNELKNINLYLTHFNDISNEIKSFQSNISNTIFDSEEHSNENYEQGETILTQLDKMMNILNSINQQIVTEKVTKLLIDNANVKYTSK
jgi:hypothetical protein